MQNPGMPTHKGLSVLEMLVTVTILSVLLGTGLPSLQVLLLDARLRSQVNDFVHAVHMARHESLKRMTTVSLCPRLSNDQCRDNNDWTGGWLVFVNPGAEEPPMRDPGDLLLAAGESRTGIAMVANRRAFSFRPFTRRDTNGTAGFCDRRGAVADRAVIISTTGRPRLISGPEAHEKTKCDI